IVGILHAAGTPGIGDSQHASPHRSGNAGATYNDKTTDGFVVDDNTRTGIGNHRHVGDTTTGVAVEAILVGRAGLKYAQATAAAEAHRNDRGAAIVIGVLSGSQEVRERCAPGFL